MSIFFSEQFFSCNSMLRYAPPAGRSPSVRAGNHVVASVNRFLDYRLNETTCVEAEGNARLIAMCPTMFEYIKKQAGHDLEAQKIVSLIFLGE
jgi:hypothetical protein